MKSPLELYSSTHLQNQEAISESLIRFASKLSDKSHDDFQTVITKIAQDIKVQETISLFKLQRLQLLTQNLHDSSSTQGELSKKIYASTRIYDRISDFFAFDTKYYTATYPDAARFSGGTFLHYILFGRREGRSKISVENSVLHKLIWNAFFESKQCFFPHEIPNKVRTIALETVREFSPKISVVMPTWNRGSFICEAISSALLQSYPPFEILVIDDGSSDNTLEIIRSKFSEQIQIGQIKVIENDHRGVSAARNAGLSMATGNVIAYLDSDNSWEADHLLYLASSLNRCGPNSMVYSGQGRHNITDQYSDVLFVPFDKQNLEQENFIDLNTVMHFRQAYLDFGGFDETLTRLVDWDLLLRYSDALSIQAVPILTSHYFLETSLLKNISTTESFEDNLNIIRANRIRTKE